MDLEILTVGTELLLGLTVDTNAAFIARAVAPAGARVVRRATVGDDAGAIKKAAAAALDRTGFLITTGGLGPTRDDVTKRAVADVFGVPLERDAKLLRALEERFARFRPGPMPPSNRTQADVPRGATILPNALGTAPGLWLEGAPGVAVLLPGVPHEMRALVTEQVVPRIGARAPAGRPAVRWRVLRTTGIAESALADLLGDVEDALAPVTLAYLPGYEGVDLRLTVWDHPAEEAERLLAVAAAHVVPLLGRHLYGEGEADLAALVLARLRACGCRLAVAESCTGGLVGVRITAIPGASDVFAGGVVAYENASKMRDLGVPEALIGAHGAVSEPVVRAMAAGAARRFETRAALAVTGIAGPAGGTPEKPVGTVWIAATLANETRAAGLRLPGDRDEIRQRSAQAALNLLRLALEEGKAGEQGRAR